MNVRGALLALTVVLAGAALSAQHAQMPAGMTHEEHLKQMQKDADLKKRGGRAMGFDQDHAAHHFRLSSSGGSIAVSAHDVADTGLRDQIRAHLREIAVAFADGVFDKPLATHGEAPPGTAAMQRLRSDITYSYEDTVGGGMVKIQTKNSEARRGIHDFLRYQITEHATGDPLTVQP